MVLLSSQIAFSQMTLEITKQEISCANMEDGRAIVTVDGGQQPYMYLWSNGENSQVINDLSPGTYEVTVTDASGATAHSATGLLELNPVGLTLDTKDGICGESGEVTANITGGIGPFQYNWSNGEFTRTITVLTGGNYSVTVTDRGACPEVDAADVIVDEVFLKIDVDFDAPSCAGFDDGYIAVSQTDGVQPVTYEWSDQSNGTSIENLTAGTYSVFAVDAKGCTDGLVVQIPEPDELIVEVVNQNDALFAKVEGGTPSYEYSWSNGVTGTTVINNLDPGNYGLTVEDAKGCQGEGTGEILGPLSSKEIEGLSLFEIKPTLVTNQLDLEISRLSSENISIEIISPIGTIIWDNNTIEKNYTSSIAIPNHWSAGVYFVLLQSESGGTTYRKFVKI